MQTKRQNEVLRARKSSVGEAPDMPNGQYFPNRKRRGFIGFVIFSDKPWMTLGWEECWNFGGLKFLSQSKCSYHFRPEALKWWQKQNITGTKIVKWINCLYLMEKNGKIKTKQMETRALWATIEALQSSLELISILPERNFDYYFLLLPFRCRKWVMRSEFPTSEKCNVRMNFAIYYYT